MNGLCAYFAYGSNLHPARILFRCPTAVSYAAAVLPNYRLTERLYADIDYSPGSRVYGFVYILRPKDVALLDQCEGYPHIYKRYTVDVILDDGTEIPALVYEMTEKVKDVRNGKPYPIPYRQVCSDGANWRQIPNNFKKEKKPCKTKLS